MAIEAYVSATTSDDTEDAGSRDERVRDSIAAIVAEETQHAPLQDDSLADLSWFELLSILTAVEDELKVRIFPDFRTETVQGVLAPLCTVSDIVSLVERLGDDAGVGAA